jgi:hypothetical protein
MTDAVESPVIDGQLWPRLPLELAGCECELRNTRTSRKSCERVSELRTRSHLANASAFAGILVRIAGLNADAAVLTIGWREGSGSTGSRQPTTCSS